MQANTFNVGDRVQLIPFKHKGKLATVKYFGAIGRKFGTWVGLELDVSNRNYYFLKLLRIFNRNPQAKIAVM